METKFLRTLAVIGSLFSLEVTFLLRDCYGMDLQPDTPVKTLSKIYSDRNLYNDTDKALENQTKLKPMLIAEDSCKRARAYTLNNYINPDEFQPESIPGKILTKTITMAFNAQLTINEEGHILGYRIIHAPVVCMKTRAMDMGYTMIMFGIAGGFAYIGGAVPIVISSMTASLALHGSCQILGIEPKAAAITARNLYRAWINEEPANGHPPRSI